METRSLRTDSSHAWLEENLLYGGIRPLEEDPSTLTDAHQPLTEFFFFFYAFRICSFYARTQDESLHSDSDGAVADDIALHGSYPRIVQLWPARVILQEEQLQADPSKPPPVPRHRVHGDAPPEPARTRNHE